MRSVEFEQLAYVRHFPNFAGIGISLGVSLVLSAETPAGMDKLAGWIKWRNSEHIGISMTACEGCLAGGWV